MIRLRRFTSRDTLLDGLAARLASMIRDPRDKPFMVLLSGGSTPFPAYRRIARNPPLPAANLVLSFTDDRHVPPDDEASNYHQTRPLIDALPGVNVLRVETEEPLDDAAHGFDSALAAFLTEGGEPALAILGLGPDGHTCSLFSDDDLARGAGRYAVAVQRPDGRGGISITPDFIQRIDELIFLVAGAGKREMLKRLLRDTESITAGKAVGGHGNVSVWTEPDACP